MNLDKLNFLLEYFVQREGKKVVEYIYDVDLFESGLLDSLDIIELANVILKNTGIQLDLTDDLTFSSLRQFNSIIELLERMTTK
jgi:acyl carrier protein